MATEGLVFSPDSIMDLNKDTMYESSGTATLNNGYLVLKANSTASFRYTFNTTDKILESDQLQFILNVVNSNTNVNSRYDETVQVECYIQYWKETVDESGSTSGYILGSTDSYQIMPYFRHESDGYINNYDINITKLKAASIIIKFINESVNEVTFASPKLYNSLTVMEAITTYGGGGGGGEPEDPPLIEDLTLYSVDGKYTIDKMSGELLLEVVIPDKYLYSSNVHLNWSLVNVSGISRFEIESYNYMEKKVNGVTYYIYDYKKKFTALANSVTKIRVELDNDPTIYAERTITVTNNNITDMELTVETDSGSIKGNGVTNCTLKLLPENTKDSYSNYELDVRVDGYGDGGDAAIMSNGSTVESSPTYILGGLANFQIKGKANGKVKITALIKSYSSDSDKIYPKGFKKEFIVDVVGIPVSLPVYIDVSGGTVITAEMTNLALYVKADVTLYNSNGSKSLFGIESVDGEGEAIAINNSTTYSDTLSYTIYPLKIGKVKFWIKPETYYSNTVYYLEQVIEIKGINKLPETPLIETNTSLFEINQGAGQLEVYPRPNYDWHGGFSFSQVSIDGGEVVIEDKGDYALITGDKDGKLNLICKPVYGPQAQCEITVSGQYPEDVKITCADNIFKVPINGNITVYAEAGNNPNSAYNKYTWTRDKLDADVDYDYDYYENFDTYTKLTGKNLGKVRLSAMRRVDSKFMASQVVKVVQSLDSDKTVLNYPNTHTYWIVYRRTDQGNRLWLCTIDGTVTLNKLIKKYDNRLHTDNATLGDYEQYKIESGQWYKHGSWYSGYTSIDGTVGVIYGSSIDIYDEAGNLLLAKTNSYNDVDFDKIIYG